MTPVRQTGRTTAPAAKASKAAKAQSGRKAARGRAGTSRTAAEEITGARRTPRSNPTHRTPTKVAQVRLQAEEMAALNEVVRRLNLPSTSEALREGLRLLVREVAEMEAAEEIRSFYDSGQAPLPDAVAPASEADLAAVDELRW